MPRLLDPVTCLMCNGNSWYTDENGDDVNCEGCAATGQVESTFLTLLGKRVKLLRNPHNLTGILCYDPTTEEYFLDEAPKSSRFFRSEIYSISLSIINLKDHP